MLYRNVIENQKHLCLTQYCNSTYIKGRGSEPVITRDFLNIFSLFRQKSLNFFENFIIFLVSNRHIKNKLKLYLQMPL